MRRTVSSLLVAWIAVACPLLCGVRAGASQPAGLPRDCCHHEGESRTPTGPSVPSELPCDPCFCFGHGVTVDKVEAPKVLLVVVLLKPTTLPQSGQRPRTVLCPFGDRHRLIPPDAERVLPLLI